MTEELEKRKEKLFTLLKTHLNIVTYAVLTLIIWIGAWIRTRNIPLLQGKYIPDIDSYYFLRLTRYIVEHGKLFAIDPLRNVPLGVDISKDLVMLPYVMAYIQKLFSVIIPNFTVEHAAIIYPIIFFVLGSIAFFFFLRKAFDFRVALLSTAFLVTVPAYVYRTTAGVADKEPLGMFFLFLAFFLYTKALYSETNKKRIIYGISSGIATGLLGLAWGGVQFIVGTMAAYHLLEVLLNRFNKERYYTYISWWLVVVFILTQFTNRYGNISLFFTSALFGLTTLVLALAITNSLLQSERWSFTKRLKEKYPVNLIAIIIGSLALLGLSSLLFGTSFISTQVSAVYRKLTGIGFTRWLTTVAENHQPYFVEWYGALGGKLYMWLSLAGAVAIFYEAFSKVKKYGWRMTIFFTVFLLGFVLNRYSPSSTFNGTSGTALFVFFGACVMMFLVFVYYYAKAFYKDKEALKEFSEINPGYLLVLVWFLINIIAGKLGIRFLFVVGPATAITVGYLLVKAYDISFKFKSNKTLHLTGRLITWGILIIILYLTMFKFAESDYDAVRYTGPSYDSQWQKAMDWVKVNTPKDAVFAHWWDYGYWVQTGGERATVLDGGNFIVWWNHLMGRYVLTGDNSEDALKFLVTHNATHLLIISDEIGKYGAYSLIGSDINYDRAAQIGTFILDYSQTQETRNGTYYLYRGGIGTEDDINYNGQLLPAGSTAIAGVILPVFKLEQVNNTINVDFGQPTVVAIYRGQQYNIPLACVWFNGKKYEFPEQDYKGCLRIIPTFNNNQADPIGASLFLSERTAKTLFSRMYLMDEEWEGFKLVYDDSTSGAPLAIYNGRLIGPLRIWEINYPARLKNYKNPDYLSRTYVDKRLI